MLRSCSQSFAATDIVHAIQGFSCVVHVFRVASILFRSCSQVLFSESDVDGFTSLCILLCFAVPVVLFLAVGLSVLGNWQGRTGHWRSYLQNAVSGVDVVSFSPTTAMDSFRKPFRCFCSIWDIISCGPTTDREQPFPVGYLCPLLLWGRFIDPKRVSHTSQDFAPSCLVPVQGILGLSDRCRDLFVSSLPTTTKTVEICSEKT